MDYQFNARFPAYGVTPAFAKSVIVKAKEGLLSWVTAYNTSASTRYLMLFDSATLPGDGAVPIAVVQVPTKVTASLDYSLAPLAFANGVVAVLSSTDTTLTIVGANDGLFTAVYL